MTRDIQKAIEKHLRGLTPKSEIMWESPSEIMKAIYPQFKKTYPDKDTFKRLFFRALGSCKKVMKNFHTPHYAYKRKSKLSKSDIALMKGLLGGYFENPSSQKAHSVIEWIHLTLSKLWEDPRDTKIVSLKSMSRENK